MTVDDAATDINLILIGDDSGGSSASCGGDNVSLSPLVRCRVVYIEPVYRHFIREIAGHGRDNIDLVLVGHGLEVVQLERRCCASCPRVGGGIKNVHGFGTPTANEVEFSANFYKSIF